MPCLRATPTPVGICPPITCTRACIRLPTAHNTPSSNFNNTSMFTKMVRFTEFRIRSTANIHMVLGPRGALQAMVLRDPSAAGSAEPVTSATSSEQNVMDRVPAPTASVSLQIYMNKRMNGFGSSDIEFGLGCEYIRERKKRGKASRKDLAQQAAAAAANGQKSPTGQSSDERTSPTESRNEASSTTSLPAENGGEFRRPQASRSLSLNTTGLDKNSSRDAMKGRLRAGSLESLTELPNGHQPHMVVSRAEADQIESPASLNLNGYSSMHGYRPAMNPHMMNGNGGHPNFTAGQGSLPAYGDLPYGIQASSPTGHYPGNTPGGFRLGDSPLPGFPMGSDAASPGGWMSLPSPSNQYQQHVTNQSYNTALRYPVLQPLIPHLGNIIPLSLACDLMDLYFASSSSVSTPLY